MALRWLLGGFIVCLRQLARGYRLKPRATQKIEDQAVVKNQTLNYEQVQI